jgi:hypothetical protein
MREQHYKTPEGMVDIPYFWVFDGRSLTNGTSPSGNIINITDADFYLRSVVGMATVASRWLYYNPSESQAMGLGVEHGAGGTPLLVNANNRWTVVPEKFFPVQSMIRFDLQNVVKAVNEDGNEISFIGWQGIKRVPKGQWDWGIYQSDYVYYEHPYSYELDVTINFFFDAGAAPRRFSIPITEYDFELQKICVHAIPVVEEDGGNGNGGLPQSLGLDPFLFLLFDPTGYRALASQPHPARWVNYFENTLNFQSVFPVPTYVYPFGSNIEFELTSLLNAAGGNQSYQFSFQGVRRVPC